MYSLSINIWFQKLMKQFFFGIDSVIYNFISSIYDLLISIARTSVLSQADILEMADKIYKLLAVFMIFKVTFSLITYVVNPDDFSDKNKGISKLITNIITSLGLLILTPYIFNMAYRLQAIILEDNTLATLIFETEKEQAGGTAGDFLNSAGDEIAFMTMRPFFTPNTSIKELQGCIDLTDINGKFNPICSGIDNETKEKCNSAGECGVEVEENFDASNTMVAIIDEKLVQNYVVGINNKNLGLMFRQDLAVTVTDDDEFVMEYKYVFSTVVGVVVVLLLITYCMDVALRSIKLSFLQLIAPIPILSYIDPKSGKDGLFKKWYQLCFKTYLSLFIRLLALYFAVYIIDKVADMQLVDIIDGSQQTNFLISIFIIIGALMFAKDLPKILEGLGIKLDGGGKFFLNPLKKFTEQAAGGKRIMGAAGALTAGAADRAARIATAPGAKGKLKALMGTGPGLIGSAARGFRSNAGFKGGLDKQAQVNRRLREGRINGLSPMSSYLDYAGSIFGLDDATLEKESTILRKNEDAIRNAETQLENKNRQNTLKIDDEKKRQTTRKNTKAKFDNTKKQGERLLKASEDFTVKKGDFDMGKEHDAKMVALNKTIEAARAQGLDKVVLGKNEDGSLIYQSLDEYYVREKRRLNARNYKSNRNSDEANLQHLTDHNGEVLTSTFMVGDQLFEAGTKIDGDVIARAKAAQGLYIKDSQKAVTNEMYRMSANADSLTGEEKTFYESNKTDFNSFANINEEFQNAIGAANDSVVAYNSEYANSIEGINSDMPKLSNGQDDIYKLIKDINGNMESGSAITEINKELAKSEAEIEELERENENNRRNTFVTYIDEHGNKTEEPISLEDAKSRNKTRNENNKRRLEQHQQRRSLMQNMSGGKK
ncbi:MAG: hypothetical protein IJE04_03525 [Bacilli bacterium]|nr:hypothetical protein [Bacilli bacterium]